MKKLNSLLIITFMLCPSVYASSHSHSHDDSDHKHYTAQEIMKIASKLKRKDKNRLLTKNIFVANVISDWGKVKN